MQTLTSAGSHFEFSNGLLLCRFVKKHGHHVTLKILIGRFSRNFFSRTAEGIELKYGIYVPLNVFNMCCYCLRHLKILVASQKSRFEDQDKTIDYIVA
jgi:hypothetical protein